MNYVPLATLAGQTLSVTPRNDGQILRFNGADHVTDMLTRVVVHGTGLVEVSSGWWDAVQIGVEDAPYFDGDFTGGELTRYAWTGTPHASTSIRETRAVDEPAHMEWVPDAGRIFDLGLRAREIDHAAKTVRLTAASDEARLIDYAQLVVDTGAFTHQASLRAVINYVLAKIGATLEPGGADADATTYSDSRNIIRNPSAIVDTEGWGVGGVTLARQTGATWAANTADTAFRLYGSTGSTATFIEWGWGPDAGVDTLAGRTFLFRARQRNGNIAAPSANAATLYVDYSVNNKPFTTALRLQGSTVVNGQADLAGLVTFPRNVTQVRLRLYHGFASTDSVFWTDVRVSEASASPLDVDYFDGSTPASAGYFYEWADEAGVSESTRSALIDRPAESLRWRPGVNGWEFVAPLMSAAGLRLFCDEARVWRIVDPADYALPGLIFANGDNATQGTDLISRDDDTTFATGVVVRYAWTDAYGDAQTAVDVAGTPEKVAVIEYARAYPGPGAATAILARRNGTGRVQDVNVLAQWQTTPGMLAEITLPLTLPQQGTISAVRYSLGDDGLMELYTRNLVALPPGSIDLLDGTIDGLAGTIDALTIRKDPS